MKHLKLFENSGCEKLNLNTWNISKAQELSGLFKPTYLSDKYLVFLYDMFKTHRIRLEDNIMSMHNISIYFYEDEWFLVSKSNESNSHFDWYKCDQFDQLKSLLIKIK